LKVKSGQRENKSHFVGQLKPFKVTSNDEVGASYPFKLSEFILL